MISIILKFESGSGSYELVSTTTVFTAPVRRLTCIRGAVTSKGISGSFAWSSGVKALAILLLRYRLFKDSSLSRLIGKNGSLAVALDSAISKTPAWLLDVLGYDATGTPFARRLLRRVNPERKRPGPVEVLINEQLITWQSVAIQVNGVQLSTDAQVLELLKGVVSGLTEFADATMTAAPQTAENSPAPELVSSIPGADEAHEIVIAESDLVVIKSVTVAWRIEEILAQSGVKCRKVTWNWSDDILMAIESGIVDVALYNTVSTQRFIKDTNSRNVHILTDWGHSMGGKNFYVLARKDSSWPECDFNTFLTRLKEGAKIIVPEKSDMLNNLLMVLGGDLNTLAGFGVEIVQAPGSQGLEALDVNPEAILIHGQNVRMKARFRGNYHEVINYDSLSPAQQLLLRENSSNSLVVSKSFMERHSEGALLSSFDRAKREFFASWNDVSRYSALIEEIVENERKYGIADRSEMMLAIKQILFETYRFGKPVF